MNNNYPLYWLTILLLLLTLAAISLAQFPPAPLGTEADPNIYSWADRDGDGDVDLVDYAQWAKEYTGSIGSGPQMGFRPGEKWQMEMELELKDREIAALKAKLEADHLDTVL